MTTTTPLPQQEQRQRMFFTMDIVATETQEFLSTPYFEKVCKDDERSLEMDAVTEITEAEMTEMEDHGSSSQTSSSSNSSHSSSGSTSDDDNINGNDNDNNGDDNDGGDDDSDNNKGNQTTLASQDQLLPNPHDDVSSRCPLAGNRCERRSILKRGVSDGELYVSTKKGSWRCLPSPDLEAIRRRFATTTSDNHESESHEGESSRDGTRNASVAFGSILIRSYSQTLGDNPSVSYGPPIQLDWNYEEHEPMDVDHYEDNRPPRRSPRQMVLSYYHRKNVLTWKYGVSEEELKTTKKQIKREKMLRHLTVTALPIMHVEAAVESAARKAKRFFAKKSS